MGMYDPWELNYLMSWTVAGIQNLGNSCFFNVILQSLASLTPFLEYVGALASASHPVICRENGTLTRQEQASFTLELYALLLRMYDPLS